MTPQLTTDSKGPQSNIQRKAYYVTQAPKHVYIGKGVKGRQC